MRWVTCTTPLWSVGSTISSRFLPRSPDGFNGAVQWYIRRAMAGLLLHERVCALASLDQLGEISACAPGE